MRHVVYTVFRDDSHWKVRREGSDLISAPYRSKEAALAEARQLAHGEQPSLVKVRKPDGIVETDLAFGL